MCTILLFLSYIHSLKYRIMNSSSSDDKGTLSSTTADKERAVIDDNPARGHAEDLLDRENTQKPPRNFRQDDDNNNNNDTSGSSSSSSLVKRYWKLMNRQSPLLTKSVTSAVIGALGAALGSYLALSSSKNAATLIRASSKQQQQQQRRVVVVDWLDIFSFAIYGGFVGGPLGHYWYV
jgi:hypothetical protein